MNRSIRFAALIGACLLGISCEQSAPPGQSPFIPEVTTFVPANSVSLVTRVNGLAWDPEAYFISLAGCKETPVVPACRPCPDPDPQKCPPYPPFLSEGLPPFLRAAVNNASISAFDPVAGAPVGDPVGSNPAGLWLLPKVPSRAGAPFFILTAPQGELTPQPGAPAPAIPSTQYLTTLNLRPIATISSTCTAQEAAQIGRNGVLEAVAKYLTVAQSRPTTVTDLLDPNRYHSVAVLNLSHAGNPALRLRADGISLEGTDGQIFYIDWDSPGTPPDNLRSARGFIVTNAATSPVGFAVVLIPNTGAPAPAVVNYKFKDTQTDSEARGPWQFAPIAAPPAPGIVTYIGVPMQYQPKAIPLYTLPIPHAVCLPQ